MMDRNLPCGMAERGVLARLRCDRSGNTLALGAAGIMALMGMIGGAVDMSRSYMVQSRLQQACDAGALAARKAMSTENLTEANKGVGNRFFDFNFPTGTLGATLVSRGYTQPTSSQGTPQAVVNGRIVAVVPTTIMRAFGNEGVDLTVTCSSKMEIQSADVAMVLDVTYSMGPTNVGGTLMRVRSGSTATETRIAALRRAVRAFYNALGPGRAGGDLSKGRVRYAFVPYGTVVNTGHLLTHAQMVDSWDYQSLEFRPLYGWQDNGTETTKSYSNWSPNAPTSVTNAARVASNYSSWGTGTVGTGSGSFTYTRYDGGNASLPRTITGATSGNCANNNNTLVSGQNALAAAGAVFGTPTEQFTESPATHPNNRRDRDYTNSRTNIGIGFRYRWFSVSGTNACRLESGSGNTNTRWSQTQDATTQRGVTWTTYDGSPFFERRTLNVSGLKASGGGWNSSVSVPRLAYSNGRNIDNVRLSGSLTPQRITIYDTGNQLVTWRGCVEERQMINTITNTTPITSIPSGALDLDVSVMASASDDATRWRPWLPDAVWSPDARSKVTGEECPAPALRLQEIGDYDTTTLTTNYPNLFRSSGGNPTSYYYPFTSPASSNAQTIRNYIDRIPLAAGTIHDIGFAWGLHLVSGVGMFQGDNPDRFNGQAVSRNIVFMTDGEMNPGEERYVFTGFNNYDGRVAPSGTVDPQMTRAHNRRLRILCEEAKRQGITVWVVAITDGTPQDYNDLRACATSAGTYKSAATSEELIQTFTTIANSIGGLRISQ